MGDVMLTQSSSLMQTMDKICSHICLGKRFINIKKLKDVTSFNLFNPHKFKINTLIVVFNSTSETIEISMEKI